MDVLTAARGIGTIWQPQIDAAVSNAPDVLSSALIKAVIAAESSWDPGAVDPTGTSFGLMQINVNAWAVDPAAALDPGWNISFGSNILAEQLRRRGGAVDLALAGYNAGTGRSDADLRSRLASNTLGVASYVANVQAYQAWYLGNDTAPVTLPFEITGDAPGPILELPGTGGNGGGGPILEPPAAAGMALELILVLALVLAGGLILSRA